MRYLFLLLMSSWLLVPQLGVAAPKVDPLKGQLSAGGKREITNYRQDRQDTALPLSADTHRVNQILAQVSPSADFWSQAQRLVQEQISLINRIERALVVSDPSQAFAAEGQIALHQGAVERFLKQQFPLPSLLCTPTNGLSPEGSTFTFQQVQVYCTLYASTQQLTPLRPLLEIRQSNLGSTQLFPSAGRTGVQTERVSIPEANVPPAEPPIIGQPTKTPISGYQPPLDPAIAPPESAVTTLQSIRQLLSEAIAAFPPNTRFTNSAEANQTSQQRPLYALNPDDVKRYRRFLALPNNGIGLVLPAEAYLPKPNQPRNRLRPSIQERFPFEPLFGRILYQPEVTNPRQTDRFTPQLALRVENGNFQIAQRELNYGFMVDLGKLKLSDFRGPTGGTLPRRIASRLSPRSREFFFNYRPPKQLEAIQTDRRRFLTGKMGEVAFGESQVQTELIENSLNRVTTGVPVTLNHTYLIRLIQYQLPKYVLTKEPIRRSDRRNLPALLATPSSDVLVAFQPVSRSQDGSYTVLWKVLNQFPNPQIEDLEKYIYFQ